MIETRSVVSVLIVDDHSMVAESLRRVLEREDDLDVVGVAPTARDAVEIASEQHPDVVLMDLGLPDADGVTAAARILDALPDTKILILTGRGSDAVVAEALQAGCVGYLEKTSSVDRVASAIRQAKHGELVISAADLSRAVASPAPSKPAEDLTEREIQVLALLAEGMSNRELANELYVSVHTVRAHVRALLAKLGAHSRLEAVAQARRRGLVSPR
jgi:DNA-binding NarL/FixJ family response regulator